MTTRWPGRLAGRLVGRLTARRPLSSDDAHRLGLARGEQVLAWSALPGDGLVAATVTGLRVLAPTGRLVDRPWMDVDHVVWDQDSATLAVWWVGSRTPLGLEVGEGSFVPEAVHERVRASLVLTREVPVPGRAPVRVALRRAPDGSLVTQAVPAKGVRLDDPEIADAVERARRELQAEAGPA